MPHLRNLAQQASARKESSINIAAETPGHGVYLLTNAVPGKGQDLESGNPPRVSVRPRSQLARDKMVRLTQYLSARCVDKCVLSLALCMLE